MSGGIDVNSIPLTSPGGLVQSGGYMTASGADRSPAVGISQMQPVAGSTGGSGGGLSSLFGSGGEAAGGAAAEEGGAGLLALVAV